MTGYQTHGKIKRSSRESSRLVGVVGFLLITILVLVCGLRAAEPELAVVIVPVANMYSAPSQDVDVVSQAILGSTVEVLDEKSSWEKVRTNDQYTGWMPLQDMRQLDRGESIYASSGRVAQVSSLTANLYRETDVTLHQPVLTVPFETRPGGNRGREGR